MQANQFFDLPMNFHQASWHRELGLVPDHSVVDRAHLCPFFFKDRIPAVP
jgi:hypothetical protein